MTTDTDEQIRHATPPYLLCPCGTTIPIPDAFADTLTCSGCASTYARNGKWGQLDPEED